MHPLVRENILLDKGPGKGLAMEQIAGIGGKPEKNW